MTFVKRVTRLTLAVATMIWVGTGLAQAYSEEYTAWHNGSKMSISLDEDTVVIRYVKPKSVLRKHGVRSGTVLFSGHINGSRRINGEAYVFRQGCEPASYIVSGRFKQGRGSFSLRGDAPRREQGGCDIVGYTSSGSNARLGFNSISGGGDDGDGDYHGPEDGSQVYCGWWAIYSCHESRNAAINDMNNNGYGGVVDTSDVPNFRNGYYCVADGPSKRNVAVRRKNNARSDYSSPYIKKGC